MVDKQKFPLPIKNVTEEEDAIIKKYYKGTYISGYISQDSKIHKDFTIVTIIL